jgi:hypothetical protein
MSNTRAQNSKEERESRRRLDKTQIEGISSSVLQQSGVTTVHKNILNILRRTRTDELKGSNPAEMMRERGDGDADYPDSSIHVYTYTEIPHCTTVLIKKKIF